MSKLYKQSIINIILFIVPFINCFSHNKEVSKKSWDEHSLFNYIKKTYLTKDNPKDLQKFHYLIVDPNQYLKNKNLDKIRKSLNLLYKEFNVTTYIYVINSVKKNTDLNYKLKDFANSVFSEITKYNSDFDEFSTISSIFRIEDKKMHVRLGSSCRDIIYDYEALSILQKRQNDLENKKIDKLLQDFTKEILSTYRQNYIIRKTNEENTFMNKRIIKLICIILLIIIFIIFFYHCWDKSNEETIPKNNDSVDVDVFNNLSIQDENAMKI